MTGDARHRLIVAADRIPPTDVDDSTDHVDAALAALRPFVDNTSGVASDATASHGG